MGSNHDGLRELLLKPLTQLALWFDYKEPHHPRNDDTWRLPSSNQDNGIRLVHILWARGFSANEHQGATAFGDMFGSLWADNFVHDQVHSVLA